LKLAQTCLGVGFPELLERLERLLGNATPVGAEGTIGPSPERM